MRCTTPAGTDYVLAIYMSVAQSGQNQKGYEPLEVRTKVRAAKQARDEQTARRDLSLSRGSLVVPGLLPHSLAAQGYKSGNLDAVVDPSS